MAIIPLKQSVTVTKPGTTNGWGETSPGTSTTHKVRVDEKSAVVINQAGEEAVTSLTIYFDKLVDIGYNDTINYQNEIGAAVDREPTKIEVIRNVAGKPILTKVFI